jgi:hypothetical protein
MQIKNIDQMDSINMILDAVESEIVEKNDKNGSSSEIKDKKTEEKKLTIEYF